MEGNNSTKLSVREFYKGKKILVTGFTGTVGKVLVEKLLYSCPEIEKIYLLIRAKKGMDPQQRIEQITSTRAFVRFKEDRSILESKLVGIAGDIGEENLGLSPDDENLLRREINIIFHSAATVRFDEPLHFAYNINTAGTKRVIDLALNIQNLVCFTHISTAFCNSDRFYNKEQLYPPPADWRKMQQISEKIDPATLHTLHMKFINKLPNTYTFTKALAEHVVNDHKDKLPVLIVRPAIVTLSGKEPTPHYVDHPFTVVGLTTAAMMGTHHVLLLKDDCCFNQIPSDITVNSTLVATCKRATTSHRDEVGREVEVYNLCSPPEKNYPLSAWYVSSLNNKAFMNMLKDVGIDLKFAVLCSDVTPFKIYFFFKHMIAAYIIDFILSVKGINPLVVRLRRKLLLTWLMLQHFTCNKFIFETNNMEKLLVDLKPDERESFGWNFDTMDDFMLNFDKIFYDLRHSILKPLYDDLKTNSKRLKMLIMLDKFGLVLTYSTIALLTYYTRLPVLLYSSVISFFTLP